MLLVHDKTGATTVSGTSGREERRRRRGLVALRLGDVGQLVRVAVLVAAHRGIRAAAYAVSLEVLAVAARRADDGLLETATLRQTELLHAVQKLLVRFGLRWCLFLSRSWNKKNSKQELIFRKPNTTEN